MPSRRPSTCRASSGSRRLHCSLLAGIVLLISALPSWETSWLWRPAVGLAAIGAAVGLLTVVFPWTMAFVGNWVRRGDHNFRAATTGLASLFGALGHRVAPGAQAGAQPGSRTSCRTSAACSSASPVWSGRARSPPTRRRVSGCCRQPTRWAIVVVGFVAVYLFVGITHPSIHRIYRKRLRRSFGVRRDVGRPLVRAASARPDHVGSTAGERSRADRVLCPPA